MTKNTAYIPKDMVITGTVLAASDIDVAGKIVGDVACEGNITLSGIIYGNVNVCNLKLNQGVLEGEINAKEDITLEDASSIKGNLSAKNVYSNGRNEGNITAAENVELNKNASVKGDITARTLSVHMGAGIHGKVSINE